MIYVIFLNHAGPKVILQVTANWQFVHRETIRVRVPKSRKQVCTIQNALYVLYVSEMYISIYYYTMLLYYIMILHTYVIYIYIIHYI